MKFVKIAASSMNSASASSALGAYARFSPVLSPSKPPYLRCLLCFIHCFFSLATKSPSALSSSEANLNAAPRVIFVASNMKSASARSSFGASFSRYALRFPRNLRSSPYSFSRTLASHSALSFAAPLSFTMSSAHIFGLISSEA